MFDNSSPRHQRQTKIKLLLIGNFIFTQDNYQCKHRTIIKLNNTYIILNNNDLKNVCQY